MISEKFPSPIEKSNYPIGAVMVVGGGIAGMQASLDLAEAGLKVYLVEKKSAIGGHMAALDKTFPTNDCAMCTISPRLVSTAGHHNIDVMPDTELVQIDGEPGNFKATVRRKPRYIDVDKCTACGDCADVCPIVIPDGFNHSLNFRKAAYKLYAQAVPNAYAIEKKGIAPCRDACPSGQRAQGYIALIREGRFEEALRVIKEDNPFPGICGRICNHRCESACNRNLVDDPIAIAALKRYVTDKVYSEPYTPPQQVERLHSERVAIIGAGPCGLTAAKDLVQSGFGVTIFESLPVAGGMLRVGVPEYRLPTWIINREVQEIIDLGVELRLNNRVDNLDDLFDEGFSAVLIAVGAHNGKKLPIPGVDNKDVITAVDFLRDVRLDEAPDLKGRNILVLGGGNVAMDCARTAVRLGAQKVEIACLESRETLPADDFEVTETENENIKIFPSRSFTRIIQSNTKITGVEATNVSYLKFETDGNLTLETVPNSHHILDCDLVIFAIGQRAGLAFIPDDTDVGITSQGIIAVNPNTLATTRKGVFAAGDAISGTAFVIEAINAGHQSAKSIIRYLRKDNLETRTHDQPYVVKFTGNDIQKKIVAGEIEREARQTMGNLPVHSRLKSFEEVCIGFTDEEAKAEASRCLQCGICSECLSCFYKCAAQAIDHDQLERIEQIPVGAVIMASGFTSYDPATSGEFGFGRFANVVSSMQYERLLSPSGPKQGHLTRPSDGIEPKRIAWIQCIGSREAERNWCSAVCCMYAIKQTIITREHSPGTECTVFYIDLRAYGKGFDDYLERAKDSGTRFLQTMPSSIRENINSGNLDVQFAGPSGSIQSESFDMVVLSIGMDAPGGDNRLGAIGLEFNQHGFCKTLKNSPVNTTRDGVYVCGPLAEPKDIPETVMSASAAAAKVMTLLAEAKYSLVEEKEYPPEIDVTGKPPRIGVFVCHCGSNIAGVVDVEAVSEYAGTLNDVVHVDHNMFTCSSDTQKRIREAIVDHDLNRIVVASCTPRTHESLFQQTIREAGLNFYLFELANIRDQCSWVHRDFPSEATRKAEDLLRMAVSKVRLVEPLERKTLEFNHDALVIGGGLAGMTAALELADQKFKVSLVEREAELGGNMRHLHFLLSHDNPQAHLQTIVSRTLHHPHIHTFLGAEVESFDGSLGKFQSVLTTGNGDGSPIINHGVTIVATGGKPYTPQEYSFGEDDRIITQLDLESGLANQHSEIEKLRSIVMIQCVGSRNHERVYCSRLCCGQAVKNAMAIKRVSPQARVYILYRDMRTYGLLEQYYRQARSMGVIFIRFDVDTPPHVNLDKQLTVAVQDAMLNREVVLDADQVVLSVATIPQSDASDLAQKLKVPLNQDGFFQEAHLKLAPVDFANEGIYLCGMAHYPKKAVNESVIQALAAAGRAAGVLSKRVIEIEPIISKVRDEKCDGCAYCVDPCPFNAITLVEYKTEDGKIKKKVVVDESICKGCGTCQATCPKDAIYVNHFKLDQLRAMTMAALGT